MLILDYIALIDQLGYLSRIRQLYHNAAIQVFRESERIWYLSIMSLIVTIPGLVR